MKFIRKETVAHGVGRPESQLYADEVDKAKYDGLIKDFVCRYYREEKHDYYFPMWHGTRFQCTRSEFLCMLYVILIDEGIIVDAQNVRPYLNHLSVVLGDNKYLVDRTGMSRVVNIFKLLTPYYNNTLPGDLSRATMQSIQAYAPYYKPFKERWDDLVENTSTDASNQDE